MERSSNYLYISYFIFFFFPPTMTYRKWRFLGQDFYLIVQASEV